MLCGGYWGDMFVVDIGGACFVVDIGGACFVMDVGGSIHHGCWGERPLSWILGGFVVDIGVVWKGLHFLGRQISGRTEGLARWAHRSLCTDSVLQWTLC